MGICPHLTQKPNRMTKRDEEENMLQLEMSKTA